MYAIEFLSENKVIIEHASSRPKLSNLSALLSVKTSASPNIGMEKPFKS